MLAGLINASIIVGGILTLVAVAIWGHLSFWSWYYRRSELCGPLSWVYSPDGWRIALEHVPVRRGVPCVGQVICCPGLACNGRIFHFREEISMARKLAEAGWSVWILHPRGTGPSERPMKGADRIYGYAEYVKDAFAVVDFVRSRGQGKLLWVGHSLGGLIGLEIANYDESLLDGVVTLGTPIKLRNHTIHKFYYGVFKWFCRGLKTAYLGKLSTLVAPWAGWVPALHPPPLYVNFDLISKPDLRAALAQCFEDTPRRVLDEFVDAIERGDGPWDRLSNELGERRFPLLAIAGGRDALAPLEVTTPISKLGPHQSTTWMTFPEFSHLELALSHGAMTDVLPCMIDWCQKQAELDADQIRVADPESTDQIGPEVVLDNSSQKMMNTSAG